MSKNNIQRDEKISKKLTSKLGVSPDDSNTNNLTNISKIKINNTEINTKKNTIKKYLLNVKPKRVNSTNNLNNKITKSSSKKKFKKINRSKSNIASNQNSNKKLFKKNSIKKNNKLKKLDLTTYNNQDYQSLQCTINNTYIKNEQSKSHFNFHKIKNSNQNSKIRKSIFNLNNFASTPLKIIPRNTDSYLNHYPNNSDYIGSLFSNNSLKNIITEFNKSNINNKVIKYYKFLQNIIVNSQYSELKQIFQLLLNEFIEINREYLDTIKYYKEKINKLSEKILQIQKDNFKFSRNFENYKKNLECSKDFENSKKSLENSKKILELLKLKNYDLSGENISCKENDKDLSCFLLKKNKFFYDLNKDNLDDLDALYFFDKINMDAVGNKNNSFYCSNNKLAINKNKMHNFLTNNGDVIPQINLDNKYIETCQQNELKKFAEKNLNTFQRIMLEFKES